MEKKHYRTTGRVLIRRFLAEHPDRQFTADELYCAVAKDASVGKSSIYRLLGELCDTQVVRRFQSDANGSCTYQYIGEGCDCRDHFHQKCVRCGAIRHLDCHATADFVGHLFSEHGFSVDCGRSILYGVCAVCQGKGEAENA